MVWELERNPVGWLERRSWSGRLVTWSWLAIVISIYTSILSNQDLYRRAFHYSQCFLAWILVGSVAVSAAGSFRRERETGMLELLLVAPLKESQVLGGRVRGLWAQFLPAAALLLCLWLYCASLLQPRYEWPSVLFFASIFLALPVVGLYFSLVRRGFLSAFLWTLGAGVALPALVSEIGRLAASAVLGPFDRDSPHELLVTALFAAIQAAVAAFLAWRLHRDLKGRQFALQRTTA
jgi:ABC-type transport system involved in multi-copper enzyme maturation permease subunit